MRSVAQPERRFSGICQRSGALCQSLKPCRSYSRRAPWLRTKTCRAIRARECDFAHLSASARSAEPVPLPRLSPRTASASIYTRSLARGMRALRKVFVVNPPVNARTDANSPNSERTECQKSPKVPRPMSLPMCRIQTPTTWFSISARRVVSRDSKPSRYNASNKRVCRTSPSLPKVESYKAGNACAKIAAIEEMSCVPAARIVISAFPR